MSQEVKEKECEKIEKTLDEAYSDYSLLEKLIRDNGIKKICMGYSYGAWNQHWYEACFTFNKNSVTFTRYNTADKKIRGEDYPTLKDHLITFHVKHDTVMALISAIYKKLCNGRVVSDKELIFGTEFEKIWYE